MEYKEVFDRIIQFEMASSRNPNLMLTYEVMWKALKDEIKFDKIPKENLTKHNKDLKKVCAKCKGKGVTYKRASILQEICPKCKGSGKPIIKS